MSRRERTCHNVIRSPNTHTEEVRQRGGAEAKGEGNSVIGIKKGLIAPMLGGGGRKEKKEVGVEGK